MHTFIELWSYKHAWVELSADERAAYLRGIEPAIGAVMEAGVELVACGVADGETDRAGEYDLFAVWSAPDEAAVRLFERTVAETGWYRYFAQLNASGESLAFDDLIGSMAAATGASALSAGLPLG